VRGSRESGVGSREIPTVETGGLIQNALIVRGLNARLQAGIFSFPYLKKGACSLSESGLKIFLLPTPYSPLPFSGQWK